jgi:cytochrome oxidase Cu insertion factor (SCO1/SenC/PrrC family)
MSPTLRRILTILVVVVLGVGVGVVLRSVFWPEQRTIAGTNATLIGGNFSLTDQDGKRRTDADFRGKLMIVEFGYTFCPDVCPLGLQLISEALDLLGPAADKIQPVFITVDPERDTQEVVKSYVDNFAPRTASPRIVGLRGTPEETAAAARAYRVYFKINGDPKTNPNYLVDHSAFIYVMGPDGKFVGHFTHDQTPEQVATLLRKFL